MMEAGLHVAAHDWILGTWQLLRADASIDLQPGTRMHFAADQRLEYTIPTPEGALRVMLVWQLDGVLLRTNLEDGTNPLEVSVRIDSAEVLTVSFGGPMAWFVRAR